MQALPGWEPQPETILLQSQKRRTSRLLSLILSPERYGSPRLLCLGAHSDDIEIGCGGTILRLISEIPQLAVRWVVFSATKIREPEARSSAAAFLQDVEDKKVDVCGFRDGYFPFQGAEIKDYFEAMKADFDPTLILTHQSADAHQDHRLIAQLTHNTFRDHLILEYEIPKYDGDLGNPVLFMPLTRGQIRRKVDILGQHFPSQAGRSWFCDETFLAMARLRGIGCNAPEGMAEAFYTKKIVL
ncbi:MAG TPA: PIG-L deacetylase family protein [Acetobacteraceae bacterium]|nr:PIG-L deacetylase family protein [Acetobacteraceae bacterium]